MRREKSYICLIGFLFHPGRVAWATSCSYLAVIGIQAKGALAITDEGGVRVVSHSHLSCSQSNEKQSYPLGYSLFGRLALPLASSQHPSQLLCLLVLQPLCFQETADKKKKKCIYEDRNVTDTDETIVCFLCEVQGRKENIELTVYIEKSILFNNQLF